MADVSRPLPRSADDQWFILGRWQEYEGEARANFLRIIGIGAFYLIELVNYHGLRLGFFELPKVVETPFHQAVTALAAAWAMMSLGILLCLRQHFFPSSLKFLSTSFDIVLLTGILAIADGPQSPLLVGYFLIIVLSTLRFSLSLVRFSTLGSVVGYLGLLAYARWYTDRDIRVPRYSQLIFLVALGMTGILLGQVLRRVRSLAQDYADGIQRNKGDAP
jgi:hypothetical protein